MAFAFGAVRGGGRGHGSTGVHGDDRIPAIDPEFRPAPEGRAAAPVHEHDARQLSIALGGNSNPREDARRLAAIRLSLVKDRPDLGIWQQVVVSYGISRRRFEQLGCVPHGLAAPSRRNRNANRLDGLHNAEGRDEGENYEADAGAGEGHE